jgi:DNA-binding response OmpR family regulator
MRLDESARAPESAARALVLVVDDTEGNRYTMSRLLRRAGMEVTEAETGTAAFHHLRDAVPDLVVLDINLPDVSGHDVLQSIRADPTTTAVPVMHVSASFTSNVDRAYGLERGADAYLTHPLDPDVFVATVRALLRAEHQRGRLYESEHVARRGRREPGRARHAAAGPHLRARAHDVRRGAQPGGAHARLHRAAGQRRHARRADRRRPALEILGRRERARATSARAGAATRGRGLADGRGGAHGLPISLGTRADMTARYPEREQDVFMRLACPPALAVRAAPCSWTAADAQRILGAMLFVWSEENAVGPADAALIAAVADQCALALERTRLYEAERAARAEAEAAEARLRDVFEQAPVAVAVLSGPEHVYTVVSPRYFEFGGGRRMLGLPFRAAFPRHTSSRSSWTTCTRRGSRSPPPSAWCRWTATATACRRRTTSTSATSRCATSAGGCTPLPGLRAGGRPHPAPRARHGARPAAHEEARRPPGRARRAGERAGHGLHVHGRGALGASRGAAMTADEARAVSVLVVDDTEGNRYAVARLLRRAGMEVTEAETAAAAFEHLRHAVPDLVVLDINLPDASGHDVLQSIRADPTTTAVPVMHVSASFTSNVDRAFGLERGADAYLTHPLDPDVFVATVRALLRAEHQRGRLYESEHVARRAAESLAARATLLQDLTSALARTMSAAELSQVVLTRAFTALQASAGMLAVLTADGQALEILGAANVPEDIRASWRHYAVAADSPMAEAVRTGLPISLGTRADMTARYPEREQDVFLRLSVPPRSLYALPMLVDRGDAQRVLGAMLFVWSEENAVGPADAALIAAVADQCALALERTRLYEAERAARAEAEAAEARLRDVFEQARWRWPCSRAPSTSTPS